ARLRNAPPKKRTKLPPEQAKWASLGHATILTVTAVCVAALAAWILLRRRAERELSAPAVGRRRSMKEGAARAGTERKTG
ncbi:MAG: hypothetical protein GXY85_02560, partial [Candidatus Brocadiaceae bacterium]|nr:hypothetical protein [Candidatus Brocadiaceae bacterium]